jgi:hypothetical protein
MSSDTAEVKHKGLQPHEIINQVRKGSNDMLLNLQWDAIVEETKKSGIFKNSTAVVDVSGSMMSNHGGKVLPIDVSIAMGLLVSECCEQYHRKVITFSEYPTMVDIKGNSLIEKVNHLTRIDWGGNTNIESVFDLLLRTENIPDKLFIFTDMQFDQVDSRIKGAKIFDKIKDKFGHIKMPLLICWNIASHDNVPARMNDDGVCMLSGYSHELLKYVLTDNFDSYAVYMNVMKRYKLTLDPIDVKMDISKLDLSRIPDMNE